MSLWELTREQIIELKMNYMCNYLLNKYDRTPSYGEMSEADKLISDDTIIREYGDYSFSNDDFCCSCEV